MDIVQEVQIFRFSDLQAVIPIEFTSTTYLIAYYALKWRNHDDTREAGSPF